MQIDHHTIDDNSAGQRVDNFILKTLKKVPKSRIYKAIRKGEVRANKKRIKVTYKLKIGDIIRVPQLQHLSPQQYTAPQTTQDNYLKYPEVANWIIYEDEQIILIDKPCGLPVHGGSNHQQGVISLLRQQYSHLSFLELAHRIDKDTSGCLLLAKSRAALLALQQGFIKQHIKKTYLAVMCGNLNENNYYVDAALITNSDNNLRQKTVLSKAGENGKQAITEFKVLQRLGDATLVAAYPRSGRTHQIRVHAASLGHPIIGDDRYGRRADNLKYKSRWGKRLYLHAAGLDLQQVDNSQLQGICIQPAKEWLNAVYQK